MRPSAIALSLVALGALGCSNPEPLPPNRAEYAGTWEGDGVRLAITPDSRVSYDHQKGAGNEHIEGPIAGWVDDSFVVGVMTQKTTFDVSQPPHRDGGTWTMVVNGDTVYRLQP